MSVNLEKLTKVAALIDSAIPGESSAAINAARRLVTEAGLEFSAVIIAGVNVLTAGQRPTRAKSPEELFREAFADSFNHSFRHQTTPSGRKTIYVDVGELPWNIPNAILSITETRTTSKGDTMIVVQVHVDDPTTKTVYPCMCAFGQIADDLLAACDTAHNLKAINIEIQKPRSQRHLPQIKSYALCHSTQP